MVVSLGFVMYDSTVSGRCRCSYLVSLFCLPGYRSMVHNKERSQIYLVSRNNCVNVSCMYSNCLVAR